ncbi:MAG: phenylalanine 4-monooxygenase [Deltaproteobacteria bacterium]|nr:phenylalanine 4-monooxygenase [Deltaproteobacteria bacterium]
MRPFSEVEHETWRRLHQRLAHCRAHQAHPLFSAGLDALGIGDDGVPALDAVNARLAARTGFRGVPVTGLEDGRSFFAMLARREFPIGAFIRDAKDLSYTPAPDVFHDMYGHLPLLADPAYADFCARFGEVATAAVAADAAALRPFERLFWFGVEFPLVETASGRRIFGGGILSSYGESNYALSDEPEVRPFVVAEVREREYRIDEMQRVLYVFDRPESLYRILD